jgi:hypothetical protein
MLPVFLTYFWRAICNQVCDNLAGDITYCTPEEWWWISMEPFWQEKNQGSWRIACLSFTLSTTNPAWTALGMNLHLWGKKHMSNCLSYGMALHWMKIRSVSKFGKKYSKPLSNACLSNMDFLPHTKLNVNPYLLKHGKREYTHSDKYALVLYTNMCSNITQNFCSSLLYHPFIMFCYVYWFYFI